MSLLLFSGEMHNMNLDLAITYGNFSAPAGTVVAGVVVTVIGTAAGNTTPITNSGSATETTVDIVVPEADTYNYTVQAVDGSNNPVGPAVAGSFAVVNTNVTVSIPVSVVASQS